MEIGWLLDDGQMCIGSVCGDIRFVAYDDLCAIRFCRRCDAENMLAVIAVWGLPLTARRCKPVEHQWGIYDDPAYCAVA